MHPGFSKFRITAPHSFASETLCYLMHSHLHSYTSPSLLCPSLCLQDNSVETAPFRHVMLLLEAALRPLTMTFARPTSNDATLISNSHDVPATESIWRTTKIPQEHHLDEEIVVDAEFEQETELSSGQTDASEFDSNIVMQIKSSLMYLLSFENHQHKYTQMMLESYEGICKILWR